MFSKVCREYVQNHIVFQLKQMTFKSILGNKLSYCCLKWDVKHDGGGQSAGAAAGAHDSKHY